MADARDPLDLLAEPCWRVLPLWVGGTAAALRLAHGVALGEGTTFLAFALVLYLAFCGVMTVAEIQSTWSRR